MGWMGKCCPWFCPPLSGYSKHTDIPGAHSYIALDTQFMGDDAIVLKCGTRLCGSGGALLNVPLHQDKSYFEVKIQQSGDWGVGVGTRDADLTHPPLGRDYFSWVLRSSGHLYHDDKQIGQVSCSTSPCSPANCVTHKSPTSHAQPGELPNFEDGDILGVTFNHESLQFFLNGSKLENSSIINIKGGLVYPLLYVMDDSILDIKVHEFSYPPPKGFSQILREKTIL